MTFEKIGIIGLGLIGGSFAKAFSERGLCVYGLDMDKKTLASAAASGVFQGLTDETAEFLDFGIDLIYLCVPVETTKEIFRTLKRMNVLIPLTDAASTKASINTLAAELGLNYCGAHPISGKEVSGFESSESSLLKGAVCVICPCAESFPAGQLKQLHTDIGMNVVEMDAEKHDIIFGAISHLPHITAFSLVEAVNEKCPEAFFYTGGGFRDFSRIAASDPRMWTDIFLDNDENLLELIDTYIEFLNRWKEDIAGKKEDRIFKRIEDARRIRRNIK